MSALKLIRLIWKIFNLNLWGENMFVLKKIYVSIIKLGNIRPFWILLFLPRCRAVIYRFLGGILYWCIWVWLAGDLTNNNAKSAIRKVSSRLTWTWKMVCIDIFPRLKHDTFWCLFCAVTSKEEHLLSDALFTAWCVACERHCLLDMMKGAGLSEASKRVWVRDTCWCLIYILFCYFDPSYYTWVHVKFKSSTVRFIIAVRVQNSNSSIVNKYIAGQKYGVQIFYVVCVCSGQNLVWALKPQQLFPTMHWEWKVKVW